MRIPLIFILISGLSYGNCFDRKIPKINQGIGVSNKKIDAAFNSSKINALTIVLGSKDKILFYKNMGKKKYQRFDIASITKLFTASAIMKLIEEKKIKLQTKINEVLSPIYPKDLTIEHLLRHISGFKPGLLQEEQTRQGLLTAIPSRPISKFKYSDINYLLLGEIIKQVSNISLDKFIEQNILTPLSLKRTSFTPKRKKDVAPTTIGTPAGTVHDPTSLSLGAVTGHAGIFSSATDLATFASIFLNQGSFCNQQMLSNSTIKSMLKLEKRSQRGLGFDIASPYSKKPRADFFTLGKSFGHTGFTGASLWIDPTKDRFIIFLSNSVYAKNIKETKTNFYKLVHQITNSIEY